METTGSSNKGNAMTGAANLNGGNGGVNSANANNNNLRPYRPFGLNVRVPERTLQQIGETLKNTAKEPINGLFEYLSKNENVFDGTLQKESDSLYKQGADTTKLMRQANVEKPHTLDIHM